jgi:hypothetical protein
MAIHSRELLDKHMNAARPGFFAGLWLCTRIALRFIGSLGPQNWSLTRLASSEQKITPQAGSCADDVRHEGRVLK